jgi:hypothetical protein
MEQVDDDDHGYCRNCDEIVHEPEKIGEQMHLYTKTALACRPHETLEQLPTSCEELAKYVRQLDEEGFEVVDAPGDGHIHLERMVDTDFEFKIDGTVE